jgi:2-hydroxychromene-2-carboxylate isomerase
VQTEEAERLGLFRASFTCEDGELFWGNDRFDEALRWATKL